MSVLNGINDWAVNQFLARRLNITDNPAPASSLAPEVFPVLAVQAPSQEDAWLRGERYCQCASRLANVALNYAVHILTNPANSRMLVMLDELTIYDNETGQYPAHYLERVAVPSLGALGTAVRDSRWSLPATRTAAVYTAGHTATAPNIAWIQLFFTRYAGLYPPQRYTDLGITIAPGSSFISYTEAVNAAFALSYKWRERPAQPSELG